MYTFPRAPRRIILALVVFALLIGLGPMTVPGSVGHAHAYAIEDRTASGDGNTSDGDPWTTVGAASVNDFRSLQSVEDVESAGIVSDDFNSCQIDASLWTLTDPQSAGATLGADGKRLVITVPEGVDYNLWKRADFAARATQPVENADFQVVTKFESSLLPAESGKFRMQGILVEGTITDADNNVVDTVLRFEFYSAFNSSDQTQRIYAIGAWVRPGANKAFVALQEQIAASDVYMRVTRQSVYDGGNQIQWILEYSDDGVTWSTVDATVGSPSAPFYQNISAERIGVYAGSTVNTGGDAANAPGHTAVIDYFFTTDNPISPEDAKDYDLTTNTVGDGSISVDPDTSTYSCDASLTFQAAPDSGWSFTGWSGDVTGSVSPTTVDYEMGMDVTATFAQTEYALDVTIEGNGEVSKDPNNASYMFGEQVELQATADVGYRFDRWSGAVSGSVNPTTVVISGTTSVVAYFVEADTYSLTLPVVGQGQVSKSPNNPSYTTGDKVLITATPDADRSFSGWSGDYSGFDNPAEITIGSANQVITATFSEKGYTLDIQVFPTDGSGGIAEKSPNKATYLDGELVTLTALPNPGYVFSGWTGALSSTDNPVELTISDDTVIGARFTSDTPYVYLPMMTWP